MCLQPALEDTELSLDAATLDGKLFQMRGAVTKNARSPIVERHEDGVESNR